MSASKGTVARNKVISCAECRRLKLRCDRQFPCHNCIKRGLSAICPEGSLPTRPKVLMEETQRLNRRNTELGERIRLLEEALASLQAGISDEAHPLLAKSVLDDAEGSTGATNVQREVEEINDSLGTLTIEQDGRSLFLGHTAGIESLFRNELRENDPASGKHIPLSPNVLNTLGIFSSLHDSKDAVMQRLESYLPSSTDAWNLIEIYFDHGSWLYNPISKSRFIAQVFNLVYNLETGRGSLLTVSSHNAALLFQVLALGTLLDLSRPPHADEAECYHQLARTALSCDAVLVDPTMPAIRTLMLMAFYHLLRDNNGPQNCWALLGLASHMAQNIGLHRDSGRWKLPDEIVQERRALFWELYFCGINQCLSFGRPPPLILAYCDCELPQSTTRGENRQGEIKPCFHIRKVQFASECVAQVVDAVLGIKPTPYSTLLAIDRKVRDSQALKVPPNGASAPAELGAATVDLILQRFMLKATKEICLLYLHRRYFARAVTDYPSDILGCRYGPSVLAAYRSASMYITLMRGLCALQPELPSRFALFWNHLLASAIIVGSIATKCPTCVLAPSAISELDNCFVLFKNAAGFGDSSARPARALTVVSRLRDRAQQVGAALQAGLPIDGPSQMHSDNNNDAEPDELAILSGRGRLVEAKPSQRSPTQGSPTRSSPGVSGSSRAASQPHHFDAYHAAHPSLLNNLRMATEKQSSTEPLEATPWADMSSWEDMTVSEGSSPAPTHSRQNSNTAYTPPPDLRHPATTTNTLTANANEFYDFGPFNMSSQPAGDPLFLQACFEGGGMGGLDSGMTWEPSWQGFMQHLGVHEHETKPDLNQGMA